MALTAKSSKATQLSPSDNERVTIPVIQEELRVGKRLVDSGRGVRVNKTVTTHEHTVDEPLLRQELSVERRPIGSVVDGSHIPQTRYEGDTLVVPVLEEVLVVKKQLRLKEELRITRRESQHQETQKVTLRSEQVTVEQFDDADKSAPA